MSTTTLIPPTAPEHLDPARARIEVAQLRTLIALTKAHAAGIIHYPPGSSPLSCFAGAGISSLIAENSDDENDEGDEGAGPTGGGGGFRSLLT